MTLPASIESTLAKREWIQRLWEETRGDDATRDLIFGEVIEDMEAHAEEIADECEDEIRAEVRDDVKQDLIDDPPDDLIAKVIKGLIEYPPSGEDQEAYLLWLRLRDQIKGEIKDAAEDGLGDLRLANEVLKEEIARLKGEKYEAPEVQKTKRGRARR